MVLQLVFKLLFVFFIYAYIRVFYDYYKREQEVTVFGDISLNNLSVQVVGLSLVDVNLFQENEVLNQTAAKEDGYFEIIGRMRSVSTMKPHLSVYILYHHDDSEYYIAKTELLEIPEDYITIEKKQADRYCIGAITLSNFTEMSTLSTFIK